MDMKEHHSTLSSRSPASFYRRLADLFMCSGIVDDRQGVTQRLLVFANNHSCDLR